MVEVSITFRSIIIKIIYISMIRAGDQSTGEANVTEEELEIRSKTLFHTYLGLVLSTIVLYIARAMLYTFVTNRLVTFIVNDNDVRSKIHIHL